MKINLPFCVPKPDHFSSHPYIEFLKIHIITLSSHLSFSFPGDPLKTLYALLVPPYMLDAPHISFKL